MTNPAPLLRSPVRRLPLLVGVLAVALGAVPVAAADRATISLNGRDWQRAMGTALDAAPGSGWEATTVPGLSWNDPMGKVLWFRRALAIPADWAGQRVFVNLRGVKYAPQVFVDGTAVGGQLDGWTPLEVEITALVKPGAEHRLEICCQDAAALYRDGRPLAKDEPREGRLIALVGGYQNALGPWLPVRLEARPAAFIPAADLAIQPSIRNRSLTLSGRVDAGAGPASGWSVVAGVLDQGKPVLDLGTLAVSADGTFRTTVKADLPRWSPEDPHLLTLRLELRRGATTANAPTTDVLETRFGFKEIWQDGPDFVLNGVKRHLFAGSSWPVTEHETAAEIRQRVADLRASGITTWRTHTQPWQEEWLEAADELGLMIVVESSLYTDGDGMYAYNDPRFWANCRDHLTGMIRRDRNHASLIGWSVGNEILFMGNAKRSADLPKRLGELAKHVRQLDPLHFTTMEADRDPDGAFDVIGLHYPHELPAQHAYPDAADWLDRGKTTEAGGGMLGKASSKFTWDRTKPLYIGEYLWVPLDDYAPGSVFLGDGAYLNREAGLTEAKRLAIIDQTIAYRRAGVSALCPWGPFYFGGKIGDPATIASQRDAYFKPVTAVLRNRELGRRYVNQATEMTFDVFNDSPMVQDLTLRVMQDSRDQPGKPATSLRLEPAGRTVVTIPWTAPASPGSITLSTSFSYTGPDGVGRTDVSYQPVQIHAPLPRVITAPQGTTVVGFDPTGSLGEGATKPVDFATLGTLSPAQAEHTVLLIGAGALGTAANPGGFAAQERTAVLTFLGQGGRVVVLEQERLDPLGLDLVLVDHGSTMTFPVSPGHPLLVGLADGDLKWWAGGGHLVAKKQIRRSGVGGLQAVVVSGGTKALDQMAVAERPVGRGHLILLQAEVAHRRAVEPAAARLLDNAIARAATIPAHRTGPVLVAESASAPLSALGLATAPLKPSPTADTTGVIWQGSAIGDPVATASWVQAGGTLYWLQPEAAAFAKARQALGGDGLAVEPAEAGVSLLRRDHPLLRSVLREDLTWTSAPKGWEHRIDYLTDAMTCRVVPEARSQDQGIPADRWTTDTGERAGPGLRFGRRGQLTTTVTASQGGLHRLSLRAAGTSPDQTPPMLQIEVDGILTSWCSLPSAGAGTAGQPISTMVDLTPGDHAIRLRFTNGAEWGGGRTFTIDGLSLSPLAYPAGVEVLALPGAIATWTLGKGRVVVDGTTWPAAGDTQEKGRRYAGTLFANLGFAFSAPDPSQSWDRIPLTLFALVGESSYFEAAGDHLLFRCNGTVAATVTPGAGTYDLRIDGSSTPCQGVWATAEVLLDDKPIGAVDLTPGDQGRVLSGVAISAGKHQLAVRFANDASAGKEDRNLTITGVGLRRK